MPRLRVLSMLFIGLGAFLIGCASSDDPVTPEPHDGPPETSGTLGAAGGTLTSDDGRLSITIPPGALDQDTDLSVREVSLAELHPAFGDFIARAVLELEPADLNLTAPAEVSFSLAAPANPYGAGKSEAPDRYDILIGICETAAGNRIPDQRILYDLDPSVEHNVTVTFETQSWSQFAVGVTQDAEAKNDPEDGFGRFFSAVFGAGDDAPSPMTRGVEYGFELELDFPDTTKLKLRDPIYRLPSPSEDWRQPLIPGSPWPPDDVDELSENRCLTRFEIDMTPQLDGMLTYRTGLQVEIVILDPSGWSLPLDMNAYIGEIDLTLFTDPGEVEVVPPVEPEESYTIVTGMTNLEGLNAAFGTDDDPAPLGARTDPWLYVTGAEGVKYYRLVRNQDERIVSTEPVGFIELIGAEGVLPVSAGAGVLIERCLFIYGPEFNWTTYWNPDIGEYGMMLMDYDKHTYDAVSFGDAPHSPGFGYAAGFALYFLEYDSEWGLYSARSGGSGTLYSHLFPDLTDPMVSCFVHPSSRGAVILSGNGQIWHHERVDLEWTPTVKGMAQNDPRMIRGAGMVYAISNHGSNSLTTFHWAGYTTFGSFGTVPVGAGPDGIDATELSNGSVLVVSTSAADNTYTLSQFASSAAHIRSETFPVPTPGSAPGHAVFVGNDQALYVALSCRDGGTVEIIQVVLSDWP